jgi:hypothetical protein
MRIGISADKVGQFNSVASYFTDQVSKDTETGDNFNFLCCMQGQREQQEYRKKQVTHDKYLK